MKRFAVIFATMCMCLGLTACTNREREAFLTVAIPVLLVVLPINIGFAIVFAKKAREKGYDYRTYWLVCFFLNIAGYILVAALPDRLLKQQIYELRNSVSLLSQNGSKTEDAQ